MHVVSEKTERQEDLKKFRATRTNSDQENPKNKKNENPLGMDFGDLLLEKPHLNRPKRSLDVLVSLAGQVAFVVILILIPLYYTQALNLPKFQATMLISPPPPFPPPPSNTVKMIARPKATLFHNGQLIAPRAIPKHVAIVKDQAPPESSELQGLAGGVPGGVAGGTIGGVLGGVLSATSKAIAPPKPVRTGPLRVGGRIQAPRLVRNVQPVYPPLAKQTRTQGVVVLDCVIDQHGNVTQIKLVSGHPLLVQSALDAVRQWKYQPTLLNGQPVAVEMHVTVKFFFGMN